MNILGVNELLLELTPVTGLAASFGLVPTKSEFKKCDSLFFERSKGSGVPVIPKKSGPAAEAKA